MKSKLFICLIFFILPLLACGVISDVVDEFSSYDESEEFDSSQQSEQEIIEIAPPDIPPAAPRLPKDPIETKWDLWSSDETLLRGANIWQALVVPELDGPDFKGDGHVGPPYSQEDFDRLAAFGANYVTISGPGLFTENPPYRLDPEVEAYLDELLAKIARADLFATIAFRTGPGRSEYTLCCEGDSYFDGYYNDSVWEDQAAQDAWVEMWRHTAERYGNNPVVVGYKLMVEPNPEAVFFDIYEPDEFYPDYEGTLFDWNQFYPRIIEGIREVDPETPILVGATGFSAIAWVPFLEVVDDPYVVYVAHQYAPYEEYTHQLQGGHNTYPGSFDLDYDGQPDEFNRAWLEELLSPVDDFSAAHHVPTAVDEFGVVRWVPSGAAYMNDLMDLFERRGMNHSLWEWQTHWPDFRLDVHHFDFRFGDDPDSRSETESDLLDVISNYWSRNSIRPSNVPWAGAD